MNITELYKKFDVPAHTIAHMKKVKTLCDYLSDLFLDRGIRINKELVGKAALVHDVMRFCDYETNKHDNNINHAKAMEQYLEEEGENDLAKLVGKHHFESVDDLKTWEEKILFYADKRVAHDKVVTLKERFNEIKKRLNLNPKQIKKSLLIEEKIYKLEDDLIKIIAKPEIKTLNL